MVLLRDSDLVGLTPPAFDMLGTGSGLCDGINDGWWEYKFCFLR